MHYRIDNLQYCNWNEEIFKINRQAKLDAVHVTIAYHEDYDEVQKNIGCLLYTSPSPRDLSSSRMPSSA